MDIVHIRFAGGLLAVTMLTAGAARAQELPAGPVTLAGGHVALGAEVSFSMSSENDQATDPQHSGWFNYTDYEHSTMRMARIGVSADVRLTDRISFLTEMRSENGDQPKAYALFVRVRPSSRLPIDVQAGRIPPTFGAFSRRSYADGNPLIGYPLAYQYLTSLRPDAIPTDAEELLRMRGRGWRPSYRIGAQAIGTGMPLITAFRWDTGVQARFGPERLMASIAVTNGTLSDPRTKDTNSSKQIAGRAQWQPLTGLTLGASAAQGRYLADSVLAAISTLAGTDRSRQRAAGGDFEYSRDHWLVRGEAVWDRWEIPTVAFPLTASSFFAEGTYKIAPGLFAAARVDTLRFQKVTAVAQPRTWDAPITRVETGLGYYVQRNLLARGTYQHNARDGGLVRRRHVVAFQLQYWL